MLIIINIIFTSFVVVLLLFCCCWLCFTMNFVISYVQYIGIVMYIGVAYVSSLGMGTVVTSHAWNNFPPL